jgi:hypothetical protein
VRFWGEVLTPRSMSLMARALMPDRSASSSSVRSAATRDDLSWAASDPPGFMRNLLDVLRAFCVPPRRVGDVE